MNLITVAVASIVDAHVDQGLTYRALGTSTRQISGQAENGRIIRARALIHLFRSTGQILSKLIDPLKARAQHQRSIRQLTGLNDHLLRDIGLEKHEVSGLKSGLISIDDLNSRRGENNTNIRPLTIKSVNPDIRQRDCANEDNFGLTQCG